MAQADLNTTTRRAPFHPIAAPADAAEANRVALMRRLWADFGPDGEPLRGRA